MRGIELGASQLLSIVIPTFNRAEFLDYSLEVHIPICKEHNVQIFISDNASTDNTEEVVNKWMQEYAYLHYSKNEINVGADANFEKALRMPETEYVWLLSDTYQVENKTIEYLLNIIKSSNKIFNLIVFNLVNLINLPTKAYEDKNELLSDLGALMTCAGVNVYRKDLISKANFQRYYNSCFIQTGIIFETINSQKFLVYWSGEYSVGLLEKDSLKKTNWSNTPKAFEIGCEGWSNFVMSLPPSYTMNNKMKCIMDFGKISGLFTMQNLILLRSKGLLSLKIFYQYKNFLSLTISYPRLLIYILALIPKFVINFFVSLAVIILRPNKFEKLKKIWISR